MRCGGQPRQVFDVPVVHGAHRDDLLREHVERVARVPGLLDKALVHSVDDNCRLEQVGPMLRKDLAPAGLTHLMTGSTDALEARRDRARRCDLHNQIDRAHVDSQLER